MSDCWDASRCLVHIPNVGPTKHQPPIRNVFGTLSVAPPPERRSAAAHFNPAVEPESSQSAPPGKHPASNAITPSRLFHAIVKYLHPLAARNRGGVAAGQRAPPQRLLRIWTFQNRAIAHINALGRSPSDVGTPVRSPAIGSFAAGFRRLLPDAQPCIRAQLSRVAAAPAGCLISASVKPGFCARLMKRSLRQASGAKPRRPDDLRPGCGISPSRPE